MGRYQTSVTVTYHRYTDDHAKVRETAIVEKLRQLFPDSHVRVTTYAEKPLAAA